eukprot:TRINITY_DN10004_c0_g5_i1.p1 TRINITY_DN10004_c0_g5~~TRINITY_DN10004_c0_g5_i1.p1  ORF type:complete len:985 (+),score=226.94 TRINITY_DN10004_c0_g5_i1:75-3029(+)
MGAVRAAEDGDATTTDSSSPVPSGPSATPQSPVPGTATDTTPLAPRSPALERTPPPERLHGGLGAEPRVRQPAWPWEPSGAEEGWDARWMRRQRLDPDFVAVMRERWDAGTSFAAKWTRDPPEPVPSLQVGRVQESRDTVRVHASVMVQEVLGLLGCHSGGNYVDMTFGEGGHTRALLDASGPGGSVVSIDCDTYATPHARNVADEFDGRFCFCRTRFASIGSLPEPSAGTDLRGAVLRGEIDGIVLDAGITDLQARSPERGFCMRPRPEGEADAMILDMRMDRTDVCTGADVLNFAPAAELHRVMEKQTEWPPKVVEDIVASILTEREAGRSITTTHDLISVISRVGGCSDTGFRDPGLLARQLHMHINGDLPQIVDAICEGFRLLRPGGRMCVITFKKHEWLAVRAACAELPSHTLNIVRPTEDAASRAPAVRRATMYVITKELGVGITAVSAAVAALLATVPFTRLIVQVPREGRARSSAAPVASELWVPSGVTIAEALAHASRQLAWCWPREPRLAGAALPSQGLEALPHTPLRVPTFGQREAPLLVVEEGAPASPAGSTARTPCSPVTPQKRQHSDGWRPAGSGSASPHTPIRVDSFSPQAQRGQAQAPVAQPLQQRQLVRTVLLVPTGHSTGQPAQYALVATQPASAPSALPVTAATTTGATVQVPVVRATRTGSGQWMAVTSQPAPAVRGAPSVQVLQPIRLTPSPPPPAETVKPAAGDAVDVGTFLSGAGLDGLAAAVRQHRLPSGAPVRTVSDLYGLDAEQLSDVGPPREVESLVQAVARARAAQDADGEGAGDDPEGPARDLAGALRLRSKKDGAATPNSATPASPAAVASAARPIGVVGLNGTRDPPAHRPTDRPAGRGTAAPESRPHLLAHHHQQHPPQHQHHHHQHHHHQPHYFQQHPPDRSQGFALPTAVPLTQVDAAQLPLAAPCGSPSEWAPAYNYFRQGPGPAQGDIPLQQHELGRPQGMQQRTRQH